MRWTNVASGQGRLLGMFTQARRPRDGDPVPPHFRAGGFAAGLLLLLASSVAAGESYPVPGFFAGGLGTQSSWEQILKKYPGIQAEFPMVGFGNKFVSLGAVCLAAGDTLRIADPRIDNGIRVSADRVRAQARAAMGGDDAARVNRFAAVGSGSVSDSQHARIRYPVSVYKVIARLSGTERVFLFEKPWEMPTCSTP